MDAGGALSVREVSMPKFTDCQALVKTLSCGVCNGTDMKLIHGTFKNMHDYPMLLGHEAVGRVVETGSKVKGLKAGDVVLLPFIYGMLDGYHSGWGGFAEYAVVGDMQAYVENGMGPGTPLYDEGVFAQTVIRPEDKVDPVEAAMVITFREVLSAIRRFGIQANANVVVLGAGPVGLCFTLFCRLLGASAIVTTDVWDDKLAQARRMGADIALNSRTADVEAEVLRLFPDGADYVIDAVGVNDLLNQAMRMIKYNGKVCGYGISPQLGMNLDWSGAPYNWNLHFVQFPSKLEEAQAHSQVMAWINGGILKPRDFISDVFRFDDILDAFSLVEQRKPTTQKIIVKYDE